MSNLDIIREKLDGGQFTDLEELASGLLAALEMLEDGIATERPTYTDKQGLLKSIAYWTGEFAELPKTCAYETERETRETPAEFCEEYAVEDSEYCKEHGA